MLQSDVGAMTYLHAGMDAPWSSEQEQHMCATGCQNTYGRANAIMELSSQWNMISTKGKARKALLSHLETTVSWQCQCVSAHHPNKSWHQHRVKGRDWVIKQQHSVPEEQSLGMKLHQLPPKGSSLSQRGGGPASTSSLLPALAFVW